MLNKLLITILILNSSFSKDDSDECYYKTLGISRNATKKEVKKAFKKLSKKYHPDVSKEKNATQIFAKVNEAYEVLGDEEKRRKYDRYGKEGLKESPSRGRGFNFGDLFGFGGGDEDEGER